MPRLAIVAGAAAFDDQHVEIAETVDRVGRALADGEILSAARHTMVLKILIAQHCLDEETFLLAIGYPRFDAHIEGHLGFMAAVDSMALTLADHCGQSAQVFDDLRARFAALCEDDGEYLRLLKVG